MCVGQARREAGGVRRISKNGSLVWSYTTGGSITSTPSVADGVVYIGSGDSYVDAFDLYGDLLASYLTGVKSAEARQCPTVALHR